MEMQTGWDTMIGMNSRWEIRGNSDKSEERKRGEKQRILCRKKNLERDNYEKTELELSRRRKVRKKQTKK